MEDYKTSLGKNNLSSPAHPKILFVCHGNAMRSVVAEALYRKMGGKADSAGTRHVRSISGSAQKYLEVEEALHLCKDKPEGLKKKNFNNYDLIVILDKRASRKKHFADYQHKILIHPFPDPYWRPHKVQEIYENIKKMVQQLIQSNSALN